MLDLLDSTVKKATVNDGFCNMQDRIRHFFIDGLIVLIVSALIHALIEKAFVFHSGNSYNLTIILIRLGVYSLYYTLMEYFIGYTLGKLINKTRVVSLNNEKPTFSAISIRTITRLIPIGFVMIATPYRAFLHDILSKTRTMRIKKKNVIRVNEI